MIFVFNAFTYTDYNAPGLTYLVMNCCLVFFMSSFFLFCYFWGYFLLYALLIQLLSKSCTVQQYQCGRPQGDWNTESFFLILWFTQSMLNSCSPRRPLYLVWKHKPQHSEVIDRLYVHLKILMFCKWPDELLHYSVPKLWTLARS